MLVLREWLKDFYGDKIPSLREIENLFTFHAFEIEETRNEGNHEVIDVKVLPDRGADCYSHRGIARELATLTGEALAHDPLREVHELSPRTERISVTIGDNNLCRRFSMALITDVTVGPSPAWLVDRLNALGQRSINNIVDATNYVMFSLGQPLHAYDGDVFSHENGVWKFGVRQAREDETIVTLTGDTLTLTPSVQLIVDAENNAPAGIAGIKGGKYAEVTAQTKTILLEAANFEPSFTRRASQLLKLQTDASKRFENGISCDVIPVALASVTKLIADIAGGVCEGYRDAYPTKIANREVTVSLEHINALLGLALNKNEVVEIFNHLGFVVNETESGWCVVAPFERNDIQIAADVIAEVGRVYGYEHVTSVLPPAVPLNEFNNRHYYSEVLRSTLTERGFSEIITSSFRNKDEIRLMNALASDKGCLRSSLGENMREALDRNMTQLDLLQLDDLRLFEIGTVFARNGEHGVAEHTSVALGARVKRQGYSPKDDALLAEIVAELETVLGISLQAEIRGGVAEWNLSTMIASLPSATTYVPRKSSDAIFTAFSPYPFVTRDIALWVSEGVSGERVRSYLKEHAGTLCHSVRLFDTFSKDGRTSYAFRLVFQSHERTLTDSEVTALMENVNTEVLKQGWEVR